MIHPNKENSREYNTSRRSSKSGSPLAQKKKKYKDVHSPVGEYIRGNSPTVQSPLRRNRPIGIYSSPNQTINQTVYPKPASVGCGSLPHCALVSSNRLLGSPLVSKSLVERKGNRRTATAGSKSSNSDTSFSSEQVSLEEEENTPKPPVPISPKDSETKKLIPETPKLPFDRQGEFPPKASETKTLIPETPKFTFDNQGQVAAQSIDNLVDEDKSDIEEKEHKENVATSIALVLSLANELEGSTPEMQETAEEENMVSCFELLISASQLSSCNVSIQGWLRIKPPVRTPLSGSLRWSRRWAVVWNNLLFIFKSDTSEQPMLVVLLDQAVLEKIAPLTRQLARQFKLLTRVGRLLFFETDDEEGRSRWMKALSTSGYEKFCGGPVDDIERCSCVLL